MFYSAILRHWYTPNQQEYRKRLSTHACYNLQDVDGVDNNDNPDGQVITVPLYFLLWKTGELKLIVIIYNLYLKISKRL